MIKIIIYLFIILTSNLYTQCDNYSQSQCIDDDNCEWVEDFDMTSCGIFDAGNCNSVPGCNWDCDSWYTWLCGCEGQYQVDNSYCSAIQLSECSGMNQQLCSNDSNCEWTESYSYGNCANLSVSQCYDYPGECYVDSEPGWYDSSGPYCTGGTYQMDNSFCEEIEIYECSEFLTESSCNHTAHLDIDCSWIIDSQFDCTIFDDESGCNSSNCDWNEDIETINCSNLPTYGWGPGSCDYYYPDCYEYLDYGGSYGSWSTACGGGIVQIDNSFCDGEVGYCLENQYLPGDVNQDTIINIQDIILVVNLILVNEYDQNADINSDNILNVIDAIQIINIILNN